MFISDSQQKNQQKKQPVENYSVTAQKVRIRLRLWQQASGFS
jgi:hypothetical protein